MVDEKEEGGLLDTVVGIRCPAFRLESPFVVRHLVLDQLACDIAAVDLTYSIRNSGRGLDGYACRRLAVFLARKCHTGAVDGIAADHVDDLVVLVRCRSKSPPPGGDIVEEIFDSDLCARSASYGFGLGRLTWLCGSKPATIIVGPISSGRLLGLGGDG